MIAEKAPELLEASQVIFEHNADRETRERCIARMEYISDMKRLEELSDENEKLSNELEHLKKLLAENGISID